MKAAFVVAAAGFAAAKPALQAYGPACPPAGQTGAHGRVSCDPSQSYTDGEMCVMDGGCYWLTKPGPGVTVTPTTSVTKTATAPDYTPTPSKPSCPAPGSQGPTGRISCDPAKKCPDGQMCVLDEGCYWLTKPGPGVTVTPSSTTAVPDVTATVTALTTFCPHPTTFVHQESTYVVTEPTTLVVHCPGGCVVTKPAPPPKETTTMPAPPPKETTTMPAPPPKETTTMPAPPPMTTSVPPKETMTAPPPTEVESIPPPPAQTQTMTTPVVQPPPMYSSTLVVPSMTKNITSTRTIATYTGGAAMAFATGAPMVAAALGALFL